MLEHLYKVFIVVTLLLNLAAAGNDIGLGMVDPGTFAHFLCVAVIVFEFSRTFK